MTKKDQTFYNLPTCKLITDAFVNRKITMHQYATLIGQCRAGDTQAAEKGLARIIRSNNHEKAI